MPLTAVPSKASPVAVEFHSAAGPLAQLDLKAVDVQVNIHKLLTQLYADLQAVEQAIEALELISPEHRSKSFRGSSRPGSLPARTPKRNKVVDIHTKRRSS